MKKVFINSMSIAYPKKVEANFKILKLNGKKIMK